MHLSKDLQPVLLQLAQADAASSQPRVRPEEQELQKLIDERKRLTDASAAAQLAVDDMELEILRIQEDERKLKKRELDDKRQLSAETDPERRKDLEHDRYAAKSRIADLLSELKEAHNEIAALRNNRDVHAARVDEANRKVEAAQRAVDALPEENDVDVDALRAKLPDDVLGGYDDIGAAKFNGRACGGCFIQLPPAERAEVLGEPEDELPTCPNCGTLLVRVSPVDAASATE
ncbi:C4-type zinc ribbon domain-containing protein [Corynebacterium pilbarense]|uniref:C4-type zinc ribbon domain-containing protein n=1 Tax=Corynebacterium pilbarense TaxID=1288393 RepID=A0A9Q4IGV3_9CORY|nr:C4-type zinc ribbon domain-containing protein [Corynebacterium pilbarense]MCZ2220804.1 C4-type zinc ribbon domain-containing protein [Corynebacterium pilbarense]